MSKREEWDYSVFCVGVKKRCRKVDRHMGHKLARDLTGPSETRARELGKAWIAANMKEVREGSASVICRPIEVSDCGMKESFMMFDEREKRWQL